MKDFTFTTATAAGTGNYKVDDTLGIVTRETSEILRKVDLEVYDRQRCLIAEAVHPEYYHPEVFEPEADICAGAPNGGVAAGDSGGPLMVFNNKRGEYVQIGINSYVAGKFVGKEQYVRTNEGDHYPSSFQRVDVYDDWINSVINMDD